MSGSRGEIEHGQPQSLVDCAAHVVGTNVTETTVDMFEKYKKTDMFHKNISVQEREELESDISRTMAHFDEIIPKPLHNIVTAHSLRVLPLDFSRKLKSDLNELNFFDIILRSHTTTFDIRWLGDERRVLCKSLKRLKNLQHLRLEAEKNENLDHVIRAIKQMKKLESLELKYCSDEIMEVVCNNCPLKELSLSWCQQVTDVSVPYILNLQKLEKLSIENCDLTKSSHFEIFSGLPHLKTVSSYYMAEFLGQINDDSVVLPYKCIKYYANTKEGINNLTKYCPFITKLDISLADNWTNVSANDIAGLATLQHLKCLSISYSSLEFSQIKPLLELIGHQLTDLEIKWFVNFSAETENIIRSLCPNLEHLDFKKLNNPGCGAVS